MYVTPFAESGWISLAVGAYKARNPLYMSLWKINLKYKKCVMDEKSGDIFLEVSKDQCGV